MAMEVQAIAYGNAMHSFEYVASASLGCTLGVCCNHRNVYATIGMCLQLSECVCNYRNVFATIEMCLQPLECACNHRNVLATIGMYLQPSKCVCKH